MRTPVGVARCIQNIVPEEHKEKFTYLIIDFSYKAVEQTQKCWSMLSALCNELLRYRRLGTDSEKWQIEMIAILTTLSTEELLTREVK